MTKVNWRRFRKSLLACLTSAIFGMPLFLTCFVLARTLYGLIIGNLGPAHLFERMFELFPRLDQLTFMVGFVFVCMVMLALPAQVLLQYFKCTSYLSNIALAALGGAIVEGIIAYAMGHFFTALSDPIIAFSGAWAAVCIGSIAWLIRRPDKDITKPLH